MYQIYYNLERNELLSKGNSTFRNVTKRVHQAVKCSFTLLIKHNLQTLNKKQKTKNKNKNKKTKKKKKKKEEEEEEKKTLF